MSSLYLLGVTQDITIDFGYNTFLVDASGGNINVTIPVSIGDGNMFTMSRLDSSTNTVNVTAIGANINGNPYPTSLNRLDSVQLASLGGNWFTIMGKVI